MAGRRSESTENARALAKAEENLIARAAGQSAQWDEQNIAQTLKETGRYAKGGPVRKKNTRDYRK